MGRFSADAEGVVQRLRDGVAGGALSCPLASFREGGGLDLESCRVYLTAQIATAPGAVFPTCGTGEFSALDEDEYRAAVRAAVEVADGRLPVVAGAGYGWAQQALRFARSLVKAAERLRGLPAGPVRAALTDPGPADLAGLEKILGAGLDLVGAARRRTA